LDLFVDEDRLKRHDLSDAEWARLEPLLPGHPRQGQRLTGGELAGHGKRTTAEDALWMASCMAPNVPGQHSWPASRTREVRPKRRNAKETSRQEEGDNTPLPRSGPKSS